MSYFSIRTLVFCLACALLTLSSASAQVSVSPEPARTRRIAAALEVNEAPTIDGSLDEDMWQDATPLTGFVQAEPFEGQPGSESTEVRILYDAEAIYVGVVCYDRDPSLIVTTDTRRDAGLGEMDSFQHLNNAVYFRYFENARIAYLERIGWWQQVGPTGIGPILASVQARFPGSVLHIVGEQPPPRLRQMANENVIVTGRVPDVTPYLDRAALVVAPLRLGVCDARRGPGPP